MEKILTGIVALREGQLEKDFFIAFNQWIKENKWDYIEKNVIPLAHQNLKTNHGSLLGSAIFHENYTGLVDEKSDTKRRYFLQRTWDSNLPILCAFMMNPSAADEISGDATVDFMIRYAKYNGYGSLLVVNTSPIIKGSGTNSEDFVADDDNYFYIQYAINLAQTVVLGWGENGQRWGVPILKSCYSIEGLLSAAIAKLKVFEYGKLNKNTIFPKHPHPQVETQRFALNAELIKVTKKHLNMLF